MTSNTARFAAQLGGLIAASIVFPQVLGPYLLSIATLCLIWAAVATSLNMAMGQAGLLSIAHGALFTLGGYVTALLVLDARWNYWVALATAGVGVGIAGLALGLLTIRLSGHYFVLSSLAFGIVVSDVLEHWEKITRGPIGILNIPRPPSIELGRMTIDFQSAQPMFYLALAALCLAVTISWRIANSAFGRRLVAIRENSYVARGVGIYVVRDKLVVLVTSSVIAAIAGGLYASYIQYLTPSLAGFTTSFDLVVYIVVGGVGTIWGPAVGASLVVALVAYKVSGAYQLLAIGLVLVATVILFPRGIVGEISAIAIPARWRASR